MAGMTSAYGKLCYAWFEGHSDALAANADPVLAEALEVVRHDGLFVGAKLHRAPHGRDCRLHDDDHEDDDPVPHGTKRVVAGSTAAKRHRRTFDRRLRVFASSWLIRVSIQHRRVSKNDRPEGLRYC
jgi:hypothetical protein